METISNKILEHCALAPSRFASLLANGEKKLKSTTNGFRPLSTRLLETGFATVDGKPERIDQVTLLPGGRFLITSSKNAISVWDIGIHALDVIKTRPLVSKLRDQAPLHLLDSLPTPNGEGLLVLIGIGDDGDPAYPFTEVGVERVSFSAPNPHFERIGTYNKVDDAPFDVYFWDLSANMLVFREFNLEPYNFWNFHDNTMGKLKVNKNGQIFKMNEKEVLIVDPDGLSLYKMPPLFDHQNGVIPAFNEHEIPQATPIMFFAHPSPRQGCEIEIPSLGWMPLRKGRQYFYIVSHCDSDLFSHDIYALIKTNHDDMPEKIPVIRHSYHPEPSPAYNSQIRFCEDFATIAWSCEGLGISISTAKITDLPLGKGGDLVPQGTTSWLWKDPESYSLDSYSFSLCPASGRLCIITEKGEVRILDYLAPYN